MRIPSVDGLRGIAILGVVWHHMIADTWQTPITLAGVTLANNPFAANGWMGVNLFFFLSGLVLYLPYAAGQRRMATRADAVAFLRHRAVRLLPLFYLSLIIGFIFLGKLDQPQSWINFAASLTLVFPFYSPAFLPPGNSVLWSLGTEIYFALAMPLLLDVIARAGLARVAVAAVVIGFAIRVMAFALVPADESNVNSLTDTIFGRIDDFVLGMVAAALLVRRVRLPLLCVPVGLIMLIAAPLLSDAWHAGQVPAWSQAITYSLINVGLLLTTNALLLRDNGAARALSIDVLRIPGIMCFSIYAWHAIVLRLYQMDAPSGDPLLRVAICLPVIALLALASFTLIEFPGRPLRRLLWADEAKPSTAAAA
ncbi:acyltransferase family protein [Rhodopseudomonas palustris]|uniref:Acyltransferase n=1 Tax=Rhodopseudomonas palustris TaxID=1076 RepID=A0A418VFX5_RHOPL|nr:acyltransferase [Rhodopseudomonas palustris]RJF75024.1 acyltransferase [Rhodopseudomonas palustris]